MVEISSFWHTPGGKCDLGVMELLSIKSWLDNGYKFLLWTYDLDTPLFKRIESFYPNFQIMDANEILPYNQFFLDDRGAGVAAFSDYFRYHMLATVGGTWADLDMVALNFFDYSKRDYIFNTEIDLYDSPSRITCSLLRFPKNSDLANTIIDHKLKQ